MTVAQTTAMNLLTGGTPAANGTLALSTSEQEWAFTSAAVYGDPVLQLISTAAWLFATQAGGPYVLVPANITRLLPIPLAGISVFVKSVAATPTLYSSTAGMNPKFAAFSILTGVTLADPTFSGTVTGDLTYTGTPTFTANFAQTGTGTFSTGTGAVSLNGDTTLASGKNLALSGNITQTGATTLSTGTGAISVNGTITMADAKDIVLNATTGTKIGTGTTQKLAFWNSAPVAQQVLATGAGKTADNIITLLQTLGLCKQS